VGEILTLFTKVIKIKL